MLNKNIVLFSYEHRTYKPHHFDSNFNLKSLNKNKAFRNI